MVWISPKFKSWKFFFLFPINHDVCHVLPWFEFSSRIDRCILFSTWNAINVFNRKQIEFRFSWISDSTNQESNFWNFVIGIERSNISLIELRDRKHDFGFFIQSDEDEGEISFIVLQRNSVEKKIFLILADYCWCKSLNVIFKWNHKNSIVLIHDSNFFAKLFRPFLTLVTPFTYPFLLSPWISEFD